MTADEIRKVHKNTVNANPPESLPYAALEVLSEIAIQLAELNELLSECGRCSAAAEKIGGFERC
jgi:hypothetical protein